MLFIRLFRQMTQMAKVIDKMVKNLSAEQLILEGIRAGNPQVLEKIYKDYHKAILHLVASNKGTTEDARDVFQEAILVIYQKSKEPDFKLNHTFLTYFYAVCRNIWRNKLKKKSFGEVSLSDEMIPIYKEEDLPDIEKNEKYVLFQSKFVLLGADCQRLLNLFFAKVKMADIMEKMGFSSIGYTKKRKFQCKTKLIELIEKDSRYQELNTKKTNNN